MQTDNRELKTADLDAVSGGFKWNRNTENPDVIDARGGQISLFGYSVTFDYSGKVSSVTAPK